MGLNSDKTSEVFCINLMHRRKWFVFDLLVKYESFLPMHQILCHCRSSV